MAKIVRFKKTGGPEVLAIDNIPDREPSPGEVRLKVKAIGLNRAEVMLRQGIYHEKPVFPSRIGYEASGIVDAVGDGVTKVNLGERVSTIPSFELSQTRQGVYGDSAIIPASIITSNPENLSPSEEAAIWMSFLTAFGALVYYGKLTANDTALITAASSSVGIAAIQVAKACGAKVIATTRYSDKKSAISSFGADCVIATEEEDFLKSVDKFTHGKGARLVFDPIAGPILGQLCSATSHYGTIFEYGALHTGKTEYPLMPMLAKSLTITGYQVLDFVTDPTRFAKAKKYIFEGISSGELKPVIDRIFPLSEIVEAHRYMESNLQCGKIVVTV